MHVVQTRRAQAARTPDSSSPHLQEPERGEHGGRRPAPTPRFASATAWLRSCAPRDCRRPPRPRGRRAAHFDEPLNAEDLLETRGHAHALELGAAAARLSRSSTCAARDGRRRRQPRPGESAAPGSWQASRIAPNARPALGDQPSASACSSALAGEVDGLPGRAWSRVSLPRADPATPDAVAESALERRDLALLAGFLLLRFSVGCSVFSLMARDVIAKSRCQGAAPRAASHGDLRDRFANSTVRGSIARSADEVRHELHAFGRHSQQSFADGAQRKAGLPRRPGRASRAAPVSDVQLERRAARAAVEPDCIEPPAPPPSGAPIASPVAMAASAPSGAQFGRLPAVFNAPDASGSAAKLFTTAPITSRYPPQANSDAAEQLVQEPRGRGVLLARTPGSSASALAPRKVSRQSAADPRGVEGQTGHVAHGDPCEELSREAPEAAWPDSRETSERQSHVAAHVDRRSPASAPR